MLFDPPIDKKILPAVEVLNKHGFKTFESCEGGEGHSYAEPTVRFFGSEFDLIRAFEICEVYKLAVLEAKRVYRREDIYKENKSENNIACGASWENPFNELTFVIHSTTGTIYLPG
jgi:hypothetical protein